MDIIVSVYFKEEIEMDALTQQLMQQLGGGGLSSISKMIGSDEKATGTALSTAVPVLVSALANNAAKKKGAQSLHQALAKDHDGSILDNIAGFLGNPQTANGAGILGHILGAKQNTVNQGLAQNSGLNIAQIGQLMQIVAPLVMGLLGKQQQTQGLDIGGLASMLGNQKKQVQQSSPDLTGVLGSLLGSGRGQAGLGNLLGGLGKLFVKR
ncbi:DUF937 domain-containing protein [bacterium]|nr:DUF937 domain-containing protein [bacterium]